MQITLLFIRMKKLLLFFALLFCFVTANAQEQYQVTSESSLNFRDSPSHNGTVLGHLPSGSEIGVYEVYGEWAKIKHNGRYAYVNKKYLKKCNAENNVSSSQNTKVKEEEDALYNQHEIIIIVLLGCLMFVLIGAIPVLSFVLAVTRKMKIGYLRNGKRTNLILFSIMCILEIAGFIMTGYSPIWSCMGDGWMLRILGFLVFIWMVYNQVMCFIDIVMEDLRNAAGDFDMRIGIISLPIAAVAGIIADATGWEDGIMWILIFIGVCQLIQLCLIIAGVARKSGFLYSLLVFAIYLVGVISTFLLLAQLAAIVITIAIIYIVILICNGAFSEVIKDLNSRVKGKFLDGSTFLADNGDVYERILGRWKRRG